LVLAATYVIKSPMTVQDMADTWAPYLTMAESLRLAAKLFEPGEQLPTSWCARALFVARLDRRSARRRGVRAGVPLSAGLCGSSQTTCDRQRAL